MLKEKMMKRKKRKRKIKKRPSNSQTRLQVQATRPSKMDVPREIDTIVDSAQMGVTRIIAIGPLLLFATESGDAWMLDPSEELALQLALEGDPLSYFLQEFEDQLVIKWTSTYDIDQELFVVLDQNSGRIRTIFGYPTAGIAEIIARMEIS